MYLSISQFSIKSSFPPLRNDPLIIWTLVNPRGTQNYDGWCSGCIFTLSRRTRRERGGMVAKGNWKTDSVTNSNEDRKTTKQATIGGAWGIRRWSNNWNQFPEKKTYYKVNASAAGLGPKGSRAFVFMYLILRTRHDERGQSSRDPITTI